MEELNIYNTTSYQSAKHKFDSMQTILPAIKMWFGSMSNYNPIEAQLVEAVRYEDGNMHVFYISGHPCRTIDLVTQQYKFDIFNPNGISFSFICNDQKPYADMAQEATEYYQAMNIFGLPISISTYRSVGPLHMSYARNRSLEMCEHDLVFILDVDIRIAENTLKDLVDKFINTTHDGVFNLKNSYFTGNGLYLGQKNALLANGFNEDFKYFWYEDTEFLMNFSKKGKLPIVFFREFKIMQHERHLTVPHWNHNQELFKHLAISGRTLDTRSR